MFPAAAILWFAALLPSAAMPAASPDATTPERNVLVELFTSEGCSSCPPADALLRAVSGKEVRGAHIIAISEHVTYWNHLGWRDPYSADAFTERQSEYSQRFGLNSVYTPQMVVNGGEQFVGSDGPALARAIDAEADAPQIQLRILSHQVIGRELEFSFSTSGLLEAHPLEVTAVVVDDADRSQIAAGENSGRMLLHVSVARTMAKVGRFKTDGEHTARLPLPSGINAGGPGHHLILFAQRPGLGAVSGVDSSPF